MRRRQTNGNIHVAKISIHAPTWGATLMERACAESCRFQSTHPRGVRLILSLLLHLVLNFNPRTHVGCDLLKAMQVRTFDEFQSTHPRGVRHSKMVFVTLTFNISIHAPTWGATLIESQYPGEDAISIHAPTWGATWSYEARIHELQFQSTHPRGVRPFKSNAGTDI